VAGEQTGERFREVVLPHLDDALSLARWLTGNRHDAEDVVQDACVRALSALGNQTISNSLRVALGDRAQHDVYLARQEPPEGVGRHRR
jgi:hypothetical protein